MKLPMFFLFFLTVASLVACRLRPNAPTSVPHPTSVSSVPAEFRALYDELDAALITFDASLDAASDYPVTFAAELLNANGNRGTDLFNATNLPGTRLWLDFVAMHIYPVTGNALPNAVTIADLAQQHHKRVVLDEAWLYKMSAREPPASIAGNAEIFRRDAYSFWAPLDQKFLALVAKLAHTKQIEYVSIFWAQYLYSYVDYDPALQRLTYNDLMTRVNQAAVQNLIADKPSATGEFYKRLSAGAR